MNKNYFYNKNFLKYIIYYKKFFYKYIFTNFYKIKHF